MILINKSTVFSDACPSFEGVAIYAKVKNSSFDQFLWDIIDTAIQRCKNSYTIENIKTDIAISKTREAYKKFGKDPNRYRPSAEALRRRILRDMPVYQIDTLVDIINLVSIETGFSIGGFDADKISGNVLLLDVGGKDEPYEAIGRGIMNIEGLPVYRDATGGIGTPTSDHERTKIDLNTTRLLAIINGYSGRQGLTEAAEYMQYLLKKFAESDGGEMLYF